MIQLKKSGRKPVRVSLAVLCVGALLLVGHALWGGRGAGDGDEGGAPRRGERGAASLAVSSSPGETLAERLNRSLPPARGARPPVDPRNPRNLPKLSEQLEYHESLERKMFVDPISKETFEESLAGLNSPAEVAMVMTELDGGGGGGAPTQGRYAAIRVAQTRRFSKLASYVLDPAHPVEDSIRMIERDIDGALADREAVIRRIEELLDRDPAELAPGTPAGRARWNEHGELMGGSYLMGSHDEGAPQNIRGTQRRLLVDSMLLGLTGDRHAIAPLLMMADAAARDTYPTEYKRLMAPTGQLSRIPYSGDDVSVMNLCQVADALDRILYQPDDARNAAYVAWRDTQDWEPRQPLRLYPYDMKGWPYGFRGMVGLGAAPKRDVPRPEPINYYLPIWGGSSPRYLHPDQVQTIVEFARAAGQ